MQNKFIFLILVCLPVFTLSAKEFSLKQAGDAYSLVHQSYGETSLELEGPSVPTILESKKHELFNIVVVDHGEVGTSCLVRIQKAYVFNKAANKFIGVYPYRIVAVDNKVKKCKVKPIVWETFKDFILIHDKNENRKFKITP